jgi:uncharacterized membrane protein YdbT with pleckstrin-like domain
MSHSDRYLLPSEQIVFRVRRHWMALSKDAATYVLYVFAGFTVLALFNSVELVRLFAASFILMSTCWISWFICDWYKEELIVTDKRVLLRTGLITRRVLIMPVAKVTDLTFEQTLLGRILNYGSFRIESAGQMQALEHIRYLSSPEVHYQQISQVLFGPKPATAPAPALVEVAPAPDSSASHTLAQQEESRVHTTARDNAEWHRRLRRRDYDRLASEDRQASHDSGDDRLPGTIPEVTESDYARGGRLWS